MIKIERWNFRRTLKVFIIILLFFNLRYGFGTRTHLSLDGFDLKDALFWVLQFYSFAHRGRSKSIIALIIARLLTSFISVGL